MTEENNVSVLNTTELVEPIISKPCICNTICCNVYNLLCCKIGCYSKDSLDARCCGLQPNSKDFGCFPTLLEFGDSPLCITNYGETKQDRDDNFCCVLCCCPFKCVFTLPCLFGSMFNGIINGIRGTNHNYLC